MTDSDHHEPVETATPDRPELDILPRNEEGTAKVFEPDATGAYIVVDEHTLLELGECA